MISEKEIYQSAAVLIREHGDDASVVAAMRIADPLVRRQRTYPDPGLANDHLARGRLDRPAQISGS